MFGPMARHQGLNVNAAPSAERVQKEARAAELLAAARPAIAARDAAALAAAELLADVMDKHAEVQRAFHAAGQGIDPQRFDALVRELGLKPAALGNGYAELLRAFVSDGRIARTADGRVAFTDGRYVESF